VGIAWEAGLLAGLVKGGVAVTDADFILGTSAGSFVGSQLAMGRSPQALFEAILAEGERARPAERQAPSGRKTESPPDLSFLMRKMAETRAGERDPAAVRREIGAWALQAKTMDEAAFIRSFGRGLASASDRVWPSAGFACTAVDALTGEFIVWTFRSNAPLPEAVASSCSVPGVFPPVTIHGRRYIDGGMRSGTNADFAKGYARVLVVAVALGGEGEMGRATTAQLDEEVASLRDGGARVEVIRPNSECLSAFGPNLMDPRRRPAAAGAGVKQGEALAPTLRLFLS